MSDRVQQIGRVPVVTATRPRGETRVAIELDGVAWRVVPLAAAARAGIANGIPLDRERARELNRALRAERALRTAIRVLQHADQSTATLDAKLARRGIAGRDRSAAVRALTAAGAVDDARLARARASSLAARGYGNAAIRDDLDARGLEGDLVSLALEELDSEQERITDIVARRGVSTKTIAYLVRRGFAEDALEAIVASVEAEGLG